MRQSSVLIFTILIISLFCWSTADLTYTSPILKRNTNRCDSVGKLGCTGKKKISTTTPKKPLHIKRPYRPYRPYRPTTQVIHVGGLHGVLGHAKVGKVNSVGGNYFYF
ncbi:uncharacterized protein LOC142320280 isoform X2 [Lycorma delicatula]|uniref:uncharacterized protein LOC142320280 isoform X2 n=1 Tax=Lycorma delicatula TaxID=130591 RepID=UPI003F510747